MKQHYKAEKTGGSTLSIISAYTVEVVCKVCGFDLAKTLGLGRIMFRLASLLVTRRVIIFNAMRDPEERQVLFAFYDGREFDICTDAWYSVMLSLDLAHFLKLTTSLVTNKCYNSALFKDRLMTYSHWNIYVKNLRGMYNGVEHSELLAKVRRYNLWRGTYV